MARIDHKAERRRRDAAAQSATLAPVLLAAVYPLAVFKAITGLDNWALRKARRSGLQVRKVGRRHFVRGSDFDSFLAMAEGGTSGLGTKSRAK
jgi:hypothetical protein